MVGLGTGTSTTPAVDVARGTERIPARRNRHRSRAGLYVRGGERHSSRALDTCAVASASYPSGIRQDAPRRTTHNAHPVTPPTPVRARRIAAHIEHRIFAVALASVGHWSRVTFVSRDQPDAFALDIIRGDPPDEYSQLNGTARHATAPPGTAFSNFNPPSTHVECAFKSRPGHQQSCAQRLHAGAVAVPDGGSYPRTTIVSSRRQPIRHRRAPRTSPRSPTYAPPTRLVEPRPARRSTVASRPVAWMRNVFGCSSSTTTGDVQRASESMARCSPDQNRSGCSNHGKCPASSTSTNFEPRSAW